MVESPVIRIKHLSVRIEPENYSALIFASQNAVNAVADCDGLVGKRAFVVGESTGKIATSLGLSVVVADGNASSLVKKIITVKTKGPLLLLCGRYTTGNIQQRLIFAGIDTDSIVTYEQEAIGLTPEAIAVLRGKSPVVMPIFSSRSARILSAQLLKLKSISPIILVAISQAVLDAWNGPEPLEYSVAIEPTGQEMITETLRRIR
ncbi:MAG: uroporphyrinogen-III synthase [Paracoccaceae bacterium]